MDPPNVIFHTTKDKNWLVCQWVKKYVIHWKTSLIFHPLEAILYWCWKTNFNTTIAIIAKHWLIVNQNFKNCPDVTFLILNFHIMDNWTWYSLKWGGISLCKFLWLMRSLWLWAEDIIGLVYKFQPDPRKCGHDSENCNILFLGWGYLYFGNPLQRIYS